LADNPFQTELSTREDNPFAAEVSRREVESAKLSFGQRTAMSIKMTSAGKQGYLKDTYGPKNVAANNVGDIYFRENEDSKWTPADPKELDWGDIADFTGEAIEAGPTLVAGTNPLTVSGAGVVGSVVRQGVSAMLPGEDDMTLGDRAMHIGTGAVLAGGTQAGVNQLFKGFNKARPKNLVAKQTRKALTTEAGKKGQILERETGIPLSLGETTGLRSHRMIEGVLRQHPATADRYESFYQIQLGKAVDRLEQIATRFGSGEKGAIGTGEQVRQVFNGAVKKLSSARRKVADFDYGKVRELAGTRPIIQTTHLQDAITKIVDEFDVPGGEAIVRQAKSLRKRWGVTPVNVNKAMKARSLYSSAARGTGDIFKDLDKAQSTMLARRLRDAVMKDIEQSADDVGGDIGGALKTANANYAAGSQAITDVEQSALGRMFGGKYDRSPEAIADSFGKLRPSEVRKAVQILDSADPGAMQAVRRYMMDQWLARAVPSPSQMVPEGVPLSPAGFVRNLPDMDYLGSMFGFQAGKDIVNVAKALERVAEKGGMAGSQTMPFKLMWDTMKGVFTLNPITLGRTGATIIAPWKIANAMLTEQGRAALIGLTKPSTPMKKAAAFATYIMGLDERDDFLSSLEAGQQEGQ
jgi:hypothetical protein